MKLAISEIKTRLLTVEPGDPFLVELAQDERKGVQAALASWQKRQEKQQARLAAFQNMLQFERDAWDKGHRFIAGIDEVGRGPLAGPVVAAAVILPEDFSVIEVNDSKQLSAAKRDELYELIEAQALDIGVGIICHNQIDEINIYEATKKAMLDAIEDLSITPDHLLIDAMKLDVPMTQESLIKGDARSASIAAASIIAKVTRDRLMAEYGKLFPGYAFEKNAGYGTKEHLAGLREHGISPIHRKTFAPIKDMLKNQ